MTSDAAMRAALKGRQNEPIAEIRELRSINVPGWIDPFWYSPFSQGPVAIITASPTSPTRMPARRVFRVKVDAFMVFPWLVPAGDASDDSNPVLQITPERVIRNSTVMGGSGCQRLSAVVTEPGVLRAVGWDQ
ncbi:Uncharacterised protein [Arthrobacter agilis]|nr:Uncharacterised protein [Arthrobacter agilis]